MNKKQLKDWELEKGIILKPKQKSLRNRTTLYSESGFIKLIKTNTIKVQTEKGIEYLENLRRRGK